jgi:hypothetical protein
MFNFSKNMRALKTDAGLWWLDSGRWFLVTWQLVVDLNTGYNEEG